MNITNFGINARLLFRQPHTGLTQEKICFQHCLNKLYSPE